jgi:ribose transport system ATP-binding protein
MTLLSLRNVSKAHAGVPALRAVSLELAGGEIHALVGENGAGKSTLIRILAGVSAADEAEIAIDGRAVTIDTPQAAFNLGLRFIHQELNVVPTVSVAENIFLGRVLPKTIGGLVDWRRLAEEARQALARLGISHIDPRRKMARLGIADRMLVSISAAFLPSADSQARVYVMDEPTAALTSEESERLFRVLREIRRMGRSVLYVSHRLDEVVRLCDRVTVLRDGTVIATRPIAEMTHDDLVRTMIGRQVENAYPSPRARVGEAGVVLSVRGLQGEGLAPVSFDLKRGEILGIAGNAGAGQSEVLRLLMDVTDSRRGEIDLDGERLRRRGPAAMWRAGLAYVPRERRSEGLVLSRPIYENVSLPHLATMSRGGIALDRARERRVASEWGKDVRLKATGPRQLCVELSGGNQQKVVFAKALAGNPAVLLLDEPTRGVDVGAKFDIYTLMREWTARGMAIVIASSDFPELLGMCDRIMVMRDESPAIFVNTAGLTEDALIAHCYGRAGVAA